MKNKSDLSNNDKEADSVENSCKKCRLESSSYKIRLKTNLLINCQKILDFSINKIHKLDRTVKS